MKDKTYFAVLAVIRRGLNTELHRDSLLAEGWHWPHDSQPLQLRDEEPQPETKASEAKKGEAPLQPSTTPLQPQVDFPTNGEPQPEREKAETDAGESPIPLSQMKPSFVNYSSSVTMSHESPVPVSRMKPGFGPLLITAGFAILALPIFLILLWPARPKSVLKPEKGIEIDQVIRGTEAKVDKPKKGIEIDQIIRGTEAEKVQLEAGDILLKVDDKEINTLTDCVQALTEGKHRLEYWNHKSRSNKKVNVTIQDGLGIEAKVK